MNLRRIATTVGSVVGALGLALAPTAAHAVAPAGVKVGGLPVGTFNWTGSYASAFVFVFPGVGSVTCTSLTSTGGTVTAGTPTPGTWARITSMSLPSTGCTPFGLPPSPAISVSCSGPGIGLGVPDMGPLGATQMVAPFPGPTYTGPYDTAATGVADFGSVGSGTCLGVNFGILCNFRLSGIGEYTFKETPRSSPAGAQRLTFEADLAVSGVAGTCPVTNGAAVSLQGSLDVTTPLGGIPALIDFVP